VNYTHYIIEVIAECLTARKRVKSKFKLLVFKKNRDRLYRIRGKKTRIRSDWIPIQHLSTYPVLSLEHWDHVMGTGITHIGHKYHIMNTGIIYWTQVWSIGRRYDILDICFIYWTQVLYKILDTNITHWKYASHIKHRASHNGQRYKMFG